PMEHSETITERHIDIQSILATKGVKLPSFAVKWINRLMHVDELNYGIYARRDQFGVDFVHGFLEGNEKHDLNIKLEIIGSENIPLDGYPIVAGNHPLGGPDGLALMAAVGHYRTDIKFPVTDFLMYLPALRPLFVPIDKVHRHGTNADTLEAAFGGKNILLYFPAGICSRKHNGIIRDLEWKSTFVKKAIKYQRDIIPVYTDAQNRNRFYRIANLRKRIGIKFGFEMALLPAEMFAQRGKTIRIVFGKAIPYTTFDKSHTTYEWAQLVKQHVYQLGKEPDATFLGQ
ncbi:MAG: glycerol acyltransferase, partial [Bacteroidales bacterium]|nr:glycerol acyltransferase [Candidatus Colimorpha onthohippi]